MTTHKGMIQIRDAKYKLGSGLLFLCDNLCKIHQLLLESLLPFQKTVLRYQNIFAVCTLPISHIRGRNKREMHFKPVCKELKKTCFHEIIFS